MNKSNRKKIEQLNVTILINNSTITKNENYSSNPYSHRLAKSQG